MKNNSLIVPVCNYNHMIMQNCKYGLHTRILTQVQIGMLIIFLAYLP